MRRGHQHLAETSSHPFRSLFDLMLSLVFLLIMALALTHPKQDDRHHATGYDTPQIRQMRQELLMLHNLERRQRAGGGSVTLYTRVDELPHDDDCYRLLTAASAGSRSLTDAQIQRLEAHRDQMWSRLVPAIQARLLAPTITLNLGQDVLHFPSGDDRPDNTDALPSILDDVYRQCQAGYRRIRVEGHTDNVPIYTPRFHSNWELSAARAIWLTTQIESDLKARGVRLGRDGTLVEAIGYGDREPLAGNDNRTEEHRRLNRRIEIVFEK